MNNIIISQTKSRLLDNLKIAVYHHRDKINVYTIDIKEIFKAYDIIKPYKICISSSDFESIEIQSLRSQMTDQEKSKFIIDNNDTANVVNQEIFRSYNIPRNEQTAIMLDNVEAIPPQVLNLCNGKNPPHMFNNPNIKNTYNLGTLLEHQKAFIFSSYKYIIGKNNLYKNESILCGASYIDMDSDLNNSSTTLDSIVDIKDYIRKVFYAN